ncbi:unnamed protein product [Meloidogyne enterolobii]|uniref:Uncharacterized protein n=1 Tax=Meloidogyne enterolobii TaxID=390850 RepID=A0ACB1APJ2_MELEN
MYILRGTHPTCGRPLCNLVLVDKDKKKALFEKYMTGRIDVRDYGKLLYSGLGEDPPQNIRDKIREEYGADFQPKPSFTIHPSERKGNVYFVRIRNYSGYFSFITGSGPAWYYVLVDKDKKKEFLEKTGEINVKKYGKVLYSGWGIFPPKDIKDKMIKEYGIDE